MPSPHSSTSRITMTLEIMPSPATRITPLATPMKSGPYGAGVVCHVGCTLSGIGPVSADGPTA